MRHPKFMDIGFFTIVRRGLVYVSRSKAGRTRSKKCQVYGKPALGGKRNQETLARQHNQLDDFTIDERNATRLDILRHLELQATGYDFRLEASQSVDAGGVSLFTRQFILKATLPYAQALALADRIHNNPKVVIQSL